MFIVLAIFIALLLLTLLSPWLGLIATLLYVFLATGVLILRLISSLSAPKPIKAALSDPTAFISIHIPTYNEPPTLVKNTLRALAKLDYPHYEVLVIDNNTADPAIWQPVQQYCKELGSQFHFFHVDQLPGYKAGALNYLLNHIDPRTSHVAVVDADYEVKKDFLNVALPHFTDGVALVQFPQAYRNAGKANRGMTLDYEYFFGGVMNFANQLKAVSSTGTLSIVTLEALKKLKAWDQEVVTEDAELGLRLNVMGYRGVYVDKVVGKGVMPHDLKSLKKQRRRWSFGNAQILRRNLRPLFFSRQLSWRQRLALLAQITAWFDFTLLAVVFLLAGLAGYMWRSDVASLWVWEITASFIILTHILQFTSCCIIGLRRGYSLGDVMMAYATRLSLMVVSATAWLEAIVDHRGRFDHTNKFVPKRMTYLWQTGAMELGLGSVAVLLALALGWWFPLVAIALLLFGISCFMVIYIQTQLRFTHQLSGQLMQQMKESFTQ